MYFSMATLDGNAFAVLFSICFMVPAEFPQLWYFAELSQNDQNSQLS